MQKLDRDEYPSGAQNDSADVLSLALNSLMLVSDGSGLAGRGIAALAREKDCRACGLLCEIGRDQLEDRTKTACCNAHYCRKCIVRHLETSQNCPNCGMPCAEAALRAVDRISDEAKKRAACLPQLDQDAISTFMDEMRQGFESPLFHQFCLQVATEKRCTQPGRDFIHRS